MSRSKNTVRKEELPENLQAGFTESDEEEQEAFERWSETKAPDGLTQALRQLEQGEPIDRVPRPQFVAEVTETDLIVEFADGRKFNEVTKGFNPEVIDAIAHGMICLRCLEPQPYVDADEHLDGCEGVATYGPKYMKERQRIDFMAEFEGEKHYGPSRPISAFMEDQYERKSKRKFIEQCIQSGREVPKELLEDKALFPNGPPAFLLH